jgi:hypothetical protein
MKSTIFRDVMPCNLAEFHWCLGGMGYLYLQGLRVQQANKHQEAGRKQCELWVKKKTWFRYSPHDSLLCTYFSLISCLASSSILMMETVRSFERLVNFYRTTRHKIAEDSSLQCFAVRLFIYSYIHLLTNVPLYLIWLICMPGYLPNCLPTYTPACLSIYLS